MPIDILMPALSPTMEEGTLSKWLKKEGDSVSSGDVIAEIETDKATMEVESIDEGVIGKIFVEEGTENVKVNSRIAVILEDGESADSISDAASSNDSATSEADTGQTADTDQASAPVAAQPKEASAPADPEIPAGTPVVSTTVREALRDAMAEEMRRDGDVFVMGEEVAEYQ
ncbi:MAG: biotin/lipoyl-containing protein, partial [Hyphomicrobiales bacterium]